MGNLFCCEPEYCSSDDDSRCYTNDCSQKYYCDDDRRYVYPNQQSQIYNTKDFYQYYPSYQSPAPSTYVKPTAPPYEESKYKF